MNLKASGFEHPLTTSLRLMWDEGNTPALSKMMLLVAGEVGWLGSHSSTIRNAVSMRSNAPFPKRI